MTSQRHKIHVGGTLTPLVVQLWQPNTSGVLEKVNLTGATVKFTLVDKNGTKVVDAGTTGLTVTDATNGIVQYDFRAADVDEAGDFPAFFQVFVGNEYDTFPIPGEELIIVIRPIA